MNTQEEKGSTIVLFFGEIDLLTMHFFVWTLNIVSFVIDWITFLSFVLTWVFGDPRNCEICDIVFSLPFDRRSRITVSIIQSNIFVSNQLIKPHFFYKFLALKSFTFKFFHSFNFIYFFKIFSSNFIFFTINNPADLFSIWHEVLSSSKNQFHTALLAN